LDPSLGYYFFVGNGLCNKNMTLYNRVPRMGIAQNGLFVGGHGVCAHCSA
jgi:hypothetical protein